MGVTDRVWSALTSMIKLEEKVTRQNDAIKMQQAKIENLTERVIRLEAHLDLLTSAAMVKKLTGKNNAIPIARLEPGGARVNLETHKNVAPAAGIKL